MHVYSANETLSNEANVDDLVTWTFYLHFRFKIHIYAPPPFEKGGAYCVAHVGRYVGRSVGRYVGSP